MAPLFVSDLLDAGQMGYPSDPNKDSRMNRRLELLLFLALAIALTFIPILSVPLKWFETLFHETSHALAAVLTGGSVDQISLAFDGSGLATTLGGIHFITAWAGYAGALAWGALLYAMGSAMDRSTVRWTTGGLLMGGLLLLVFWLQWNLASLAIMAVLLTILGLMLHPWAAKLAKPMLRLMGAFVLVSAIVSPSYLLQTDQPNDAATLASMTGIPAILWAVGWMGLGVLTTLVLFWWEGKSQRHHALSARFQVRKTPRWKFWANGFH